MNWELLLWIGCVTALVVLIVTAGINSIIRSYYLAKEEHIGRIAKAFGNAFSTINKALDDKLKKVKDEVKKATDEIKKEQ